MFAFTSTTSNGAISQKLPNNILQKFPKIMRNDITCSIVINLI